MYCKYLKQKQKGYVKFIYCDKQAKTITDYDECRNCPLKEYKEVKKKPMKKYTYKQKKLERDRFSILTDNMKKCMLCEKNAVNKHEIFFGTGQRKISMKYGLVIPLCYQCHLRMHRSSVQQAIWHVKGQEAFEKEYPDLNFLETFGENYK